MTAERYRHLIGGLATSSEPITLESVKEASEKLEDEGSRKLAERDGFAQTIQETLAKAEGTLAISQDAETVDSALAQLKERLVASDSLRAVDDSQFADERGAQRRIRVEHGIQH